MSVQSASDEFSSEEFLNQILGTDEGYLYLATKTPGSNKPLQSVGGFSQRFFHWPVEKAEAISFIERMQTTHEVYYAPALFSTGANGQRENIKGAKVFWCEFDGNIPSNLSNIPEPSIRIRSSSDDHEHWYWLLADRVDVEIIEYVNRGLAYALGADASGWDANQILRPINTINHKRGLPVVLLSHSGMAYDPKDFAHIPAPPPPASAPLPVNIPAIEDVIPKYQFPEAVWDLFKIGMEEGKRSEALMSLGYYLCEMQLKDEEVFAMLLNADDRWGKFAGRSDQAKRLMEIVVRARVKYPLEEEIGTSVFDLTAYGFTSLLKVEINVNWIYKGLLHDKGYMLVTGPSGVGKTQFSLQAAEQAVLGVPFLGFEVERPENRILFLSLEMALEEIKVFIDLHSQKYTPEQLSNLEENLRIMPVGEPLYFTDKTVQDWLETTVREGGYTGVIIDSLGSMTPGSISEEVNAKALMDWMDRFRNRLKAFTWIIHHHRKASSGNSVPNDLSDVYGSQYLTARASSVVSLYEIGSGAVKIKGLKTRFTKRFQTFETHRDEQLHFHSKVPGITIKDTSLPVGEKSAETNITDNNKDSPGDGKAAW